jgi:hypothetical protein
MVARETMKVKVIVAPPRRQQEMAVGPEQGRELDADELAR